MTFNKLNAWVAMTTLCCSTTYANTLATINAEEILGFEVGFRAELNQRLNSAEAQKEISRLGVDSNEVQLRVAAMTEQELLQIRQGIEREAGGELITISITTLLLIIILVILIT